jgi:hypothetical protein
MKLGWVKKLLIFGIGALVVLVAVVMIVGSLLPREHVAARTIVLDQPPQAIWGVITAFGDAPSWREDIATVRREERSGETVWVEVDQMGDEIAYRTLESQAPTRLVREIVGEDLPFGGKWTFLIDPEDGSAGDGAAGDGAAGEGKSRVTIREDGFVDNAFFRFVSVVMIGHTTFIDRYLEFLGARFGEAVTPVDA